MDSQIDHGTLNWVKEEIDETLKQASHALEEYVENPDDQTHLRFCFTYIHQVYGTLQMVELYGAALFAEEMEKLTKALLDNQVSQKNDAYEVLMGAILQLPDYLERIQSGLKDDALILLPFLNDLRAIRGDNLLSENALFAPDISNAEPIEIENRQIDIDGGGIRQLAKKLRHNFQIGLLEWIRNQNPKPGLEKMRDVIIQLEQSTDNEEVVRLWWVCNGVLEGLLDEGLESNAALKKIIGLVDQEIKRVIDEGEQVNEHSSELLKNMLYYVAGSRSNGNRINAIKEKFNLGGAVPSKEEIDTARASISGPNVQLMETVSEAIREDLTRVKDSMDLFLRSDSHQIEDLGAQAETLRKMADTLGMLGMGIPRKIVQEQEVILSDILAGKSEPTEARLMGIAGSLLFVESSLEGLVKSRGAKQNEAAAEEAMRDVEHQLPEAEIKQIQLSVMKEVGIDIAKAKDAIVTFIDAGMDHSMLEDVPVLLEQARGGMQMLTMDHAANLLGKVIEYVSNHLIHDKGNLTQQQQEHLADAISSIEYYLEAIQEDRSEKGPILALAHESLEKLGYSVEIPEGLLDEQKAEVERPMPYKFDEQARTVEPQAAEPVETENIQLEEALEISEPEIEQEPEQIAEPESEQAEEIKEQPIAAKEEIKLLDDIDDEIVEIFIEEAEEELGVIHAVLPGWKKDTGDIESLKRMRRAYHTMKGSGRMVGAVQIGEYSWSLENMLNRILDSTIPVTPEMLGLMDESLEMLPKLVEKLKDGSLDDVDVQPMIDRAFELIEKEKASAKPKPEDTIVEEVEESIDSVHGMAEKYDAQAEYEMDPVLHDIFSKESSGHLANIHQFIDGCQSDAGQCTITDKLIRALHTLHGSARMAGANNIAEISGLLEKYTKSLLGNEIEMPAEGLAVLVGCIEAIETMLEQINKKEVIPADASDVINKLETLYKIELEKEEQRLKDEHSAAMGQHQEAEVNQEVTEYDEEIVEVFLEEGVEILDASEMIVQKWADDHDNMELMAELQRELHTLKGGARMSGITAMGDLSHGVESLLVEITEGRLPVSKPFIDTIHMALDKLYNMLQRTQERLPLEAAKDLEQELLNLRDGKPASMVIAIEQKAEAPVEEKAEPVPEIEEVAEAAPEEVPEEVPETTREAEKMAEFPIAEKIQSAPTVTPREEPAIAAQQPGETIRVSAELLDNLVNFAGEVSIYRSRLDQNNGAFRYNLVEMDQTVARLREQLRKLEMETEAQILFRYEQEGDVDENFDPLEMDRYSQIQQLSRALMETTSDVSSIQGLLDSLVRESETLLLQQSRVNTELQEGLMRTRMVSFSGMVPRMRRIVRQTCQELGKKAELHIVGEHGEIDRTLLERLVSPLEHMLRNAVSHGIERPADRIAAGKSETGNITLIIKREGAEVVFMITDDGNGINLNAIRNKAQERGLMDETAELTNHDIMQFILESGFSTAEKVTQISGRGVGMDVVNIEIKQLGGTLDIDSTYKHGSTFTIRLPFTLAVNQALLVASGDDTYAIPLTSIEGIVRMSREELLNYFANPKEHYKYAGHDYQVMSLGLQLGTGSAQLSTGAQLYPLLLARSGDHRTAIQIDRLLGSREIVVKSVGPQISTVRGVSGATILGDGRVVLILDIGAVIRSGAAHKQEIEAEAIERLASPKHTKPRIMVVDDSITVRKVSTRLLERNNMEVTTAKDGVDAVAQLQDHIPDLMLLDIEMPRMDGFELATYMRNEARLKNIPIVMITSRTGDKHRKRAEEIGVNRYLGKPFVESDLLENISELLEALNADA